LQRAVSEMVGKRIVAAMAGQRSAAVLPLIKPLLSQKSYRGHDGAPSVQKRFLAGNGASARGTARK
jgi:hypothetical protein